MINYNSNQLDLSVVSGKVTFKRLRVEYIDKEKGNMSMVNIRQQWGIEGYYAPTNDWFFHKPHTFWSKGKKENIIEYQARKKKDLPAPNTYKLSCDWTKNPKGKFFKGPRTTIIDEILK